VGVVNHYRSHCRFAKLRGMMYGGKYSDVIGRETRIFLCAQNINFQAMDGFFLDQSRRCVYPSTPNHGISPNDSVSDSG